MPAVNSTRHGTRLEDIPCGSASLIGGLPVHYRLPIPEGGASQQATGGDEVRVCKAVVMQCTTTPLVFGATGGAKS